MFKSQANPSFNSKLSEDIFNEKYRHSGAETWAELANILVEHVCGERVSNDKKSTLKEYIRDLKLIPGGRYLYYAGRQKPFFNNCYLLKAEEDTREDWANLAWKAESCLLTGGGIGVDYSVYRPSGSLIRRTGGTASGPIPKMLGVNNQGRYIIQGGSRRSAIYASLLHSHNDITDFLSVKDWNNQKAGSSGLTLGDLKRQDFNFPAPLDMTNISVNYDTQWLLDYYKTGNVGEVFLKNVELALKNGEPGFSFNFFDKESETLRNAPVSGETQVLTDKGYKTIEDIVNQPILVWTGKQFAETVFVRTKELTKTICVYFTGGRSISCDPDHEFFLEDGSKKAAKDLKKEDVLFVSLPKVIETAFDPKSYTLGYMFGDGHFRKSGGGEISLCSEESKKCLPYFDLKAFSSINLQDSRGFIRCYITTSWTKYLSKEIFPSEYATPSLIAGLFDSDGSYNSKRGSIRLASRHYSFLEGVQRYLESIGILSGITKGGISTYGKKQGYLLVIMSDYVSLFSRLIPTKRFIVEQYESYRKSKLKVLKVVEDKLQDVYCCDVKVPEHSFQANGVILANCTEVTSSDDSDVCNLGSINLARINNLDEFASVVELGTLFLLCGTLVAELPYDRIRHIRDKNRRLGLGLMGIHEWLIQRGYRYEVIPELHKWLNVYKGISNKSSRDYADSFNISRPVASRSIAPTGTIGILAGTTTGIEPIYAVAYKRRYLIDGTKWKYQYKIDDIALKTIQEYDIKPDKIETASELANDPERRIAFQADIQDYVDMAISSTINLPAFEEGKTDPTTFANTLAKYAPRLRGFTCYPDGSRGGQPLVKVDYEEAKSKLGEEFEENSEHNDICELTGSGYCGI